MVASHLLLVDDEESICWGLQRLAVELGHTAAVCGSAEQGLRLARRQPPDLVILDVRLPGMDGLTALEHFRKQLGAVPVVIITAYGELETAVEALRRGAFEYLVKPFDLDLAERTIVRALEATQTPPAESLDAAAHDLPHQLVGRSAVMQGVFRQIALVAPTDACVHLVGESGTGKELVAEAIHRYSRRADQHFVPVHLAALNPALVESELFGYVRGAFTGADQPRQGLLDQADGGTLFLDEVAEIPLAVQAKLLRVLERREVWPVGGDQPRRADFRLISATHQNLAECVAEGTFRQDLYYRLVTFQIELPPLRQRREDIGELAQYFVSRMAERNQLPRPQLSPQALTELARRAWPGNVRELRNALEHAVIVCRGEPITLAHLPPSLAAESTAATDSLATRLAQWTSAELQRGDSAGDLYERFLAVVEPPLLCTALEHAHGQVAAAARLLGLHRTTLKKKLDQFGLRSGE